MILFPFHAQAKYFGSSSEIFYPSLEPVHVTTNTDIQSFLVFKKILLHISRKLGALFFVQIKLLVLLALLFILVPIGSISSAGSIGSITLSLLELFITPKKQGSKLFEMHG